MPWLGFLEFDGFSGGTVDIDEVGALRQSAHVEGVGTAGESGGEHLCTIAVVYTEEVGLALKLALEFHLSLIDNRAGIDVDHLEWGGDDVHALIPGADEILVCRASIDYDMIRTGKSTFLLMIGFGLVDELAVMVPFVAGETVGLIVNKAAVVDAQHIVEDLNEIFVGEVDGEGNRVGGGVDRSKVGECDSNLV